METVKVTGRPDVASLLRGMADGIDGGAISVGSRVIGCPDDVVAVINLPEQGANHRLVMHVRFEEPGTAHPPLLVEEELSHPGA